MNTSNYSNIEFINFDSLVNPEDQACLKDDDIEMDYLNNYLLEKYESEGYDSQCESSFVLENQSQISFHSDVPSSKFREVQTNDAYSEVNRSTTTSPSESPSETPEILEKQFICGYDNCKKSFKFKWILDRHYLSHKSAKLYKCTFRGCLKSYKSKENQTLHFKNIHLKEKPYSCRYCPSVFSHRNGKTYHERKFHTNYLPHKCTFEECEMNFASKSALTYHLKSQHSHKNLKKNSSKGVPRSRFNGENLKIVNEFDNSNMDYQY